MAGGSLHATPASLVYWPLAHATHSPPALLSKPASHKHAEPPGGLCALLGHGMITQDADPVLPSGEVPSRHTTQAPFSVLGPYCPAGHAHGPKADSSSKWRHVPPTIKRYLPTALQFTVTVLPLPLGVNAHCVFNAESNVDPSPTLILTPSKRFVMVFTLDALLMIITEKSCLEIPKSTDHQLSGWHFVWKKAPVAPSTALDAGLPYPLSRNDD